MASICQICGKGPTVGNKVSHANNKTKRRWLVNLQRIKAKVNGTVRRLRVCAACIRAGRVQKAA